MPRMAKTFDNISEASATNYLFLFAQRTLALQNEPPTPPPLNALGLPCQTVCLLRAWLKEKPAGEVEQAGEALEAGGSASAAAPGLEMSETMELPSDNASAKLKGTAAKVAADKARLPTGSVSSEEATPVIDETVATEAVTMEAAVGAAGVGASMEEVEEAGETKVAREKWATDQADTSVEEVEDKGKTFAEKVEPLAKKITAYILDHQDDAAQEDRWRTTMKRETMKCFREQREASGNQRAAIDQQREEVQTVKAEVKAEVQTVKAELKAEVQKIEAGVQKVEMEMQQRFDEVHSKMDEKMDQLVKNIADLVKQH
jgi:hypothetical protein